MNDELEKEIVEISEKLGIDCIAPNSVKFITGNRVNLNKFFRHERFHMEFTRNISDFSDALINLLIVKQKANWIDIQKKCVLSVNFIEKYKKHISWHLMNKEGILSPAIIDHYKDEIDWNIAAYNKNISHLLNLYRSELKKVNIIVSGRKAYRLILED